MDGFGRKALDLLVDPYQRQDKVVAAEHILGRRLRLNDQRPEARAGESERARKRNLSSGLGRC